MRRAGKRGQKEGHKQHPFFIEDIENKKRWFALKKKWRERERERGETLSGSLSQALRECCPNLSHSYTHTHTHTLTPIHAYGILNLLQRALLEVVTEPPGVATQQRRILPVR